MKISESKKGILNVRVPHNKARLKGQIEALTWQIKHDTSEKDKHIHKETLRALQSEYHRIYGG